MNKQLNDILRRVETGMTTAADAAALRAEIEMSRAQIVRLESALIEGAARVVSPPAQEAAR